MATSPAGGACAAADAAAKTATHGAVNPRSLIRNLLRFSVRELYRLAPSLPLHPPLAVAVTQSTLAKPAHGQRVDAVFLRLHPRRETGFVVLRRDANARLYDSRTTVEFCGHEMHGRAMLRFVRLERAPMRVQAWEFRQ